MEIFNWDESPEYNEYLALKKKIVYCRDCKYFYANPYYEGEGGRPGYCEALAYIMDGYYKGAEDRDFCDFCSKGERK